MWISLSVSVSQGAIENGTSLFTYDTKLLLDSFFYGDKHNASFLPVFSPHEDPADPLLKEMVSHCGSDPFCRFDVLTTRNLQVGNSTRLSHQNHKLLVEHLEPGDTTFHETSLQNYRILWVGRDPLGKSSPNLKWTFHREHHYRYFYRASKELTMFEEALLNCETVHAPINNLIMGNHLCTRKSLYW